MKKEPIKTIAVVGTDTGVGKTIITGAIARCLLLNSIDPAVYKPAESGCQPSPQGLVPSDATFLMEASASTHPLDLVCPYRLPAALSPAAAAHLHGVQISFSHLLDCHRQLERSSQVVLLEGAGGLMVPYGPDWLLADLLQSIPCVCLVVGRSTLGTINHTLLTLSELDRRQIPVVGVILNRLTSAPALEEKSNPSAISSYSAVGQVSVFPHMPPESLTDFDRLASAAASALDLSSLLATLG